MPIILRRLRAALVLAALWALLAGAVGVLVGVGLTAVRNPYPVLPDVAQWWFESRGLILAVAARWAAAGGALGVLFAGVLARAERGREGGQLSGARAAAWGGVAGGALLLADWVRLTVTRPAAAAAAPSVLPWLLLVLTALVGAGFGWLTVRWARERAAGSPAPGDGAPLLGAGHAEAPGVGGAGARRHAPVA